ncbi:hypothetical protein BH18THE1_BH18THE1_03000 [soil metagenome]
MLGLGLLMIVGITLIPISAVTSIVDNKTSQVEGGKMTGKNMTMPGGNMTFGTTLENAKMHLMEAIMDLKIGDTKGAIMQLNMTDQEIKMHEQEMKEMTMIMRGKMSSDPMGTPNKSSIR